MKMIFISVLLFLPFDVRGSPPLEPTGQNLRFAPALWHPKPRRAGPRILGALQEFSLRENIREAEAVSQIREGLEAVRRDLRLLRRGSYDWFWRPQYMQKKIKGYQFELSSENNGPLVIMHF